MRTSEKQEVDVSRRDDRPGDLDELVQAECRKADIRNHGVVSDYACPSTRRVTGALAGALAIPIAFASSARTSTRLVQGVSLGGAQGAPCIVAPVVLRLCDSIRVISLDW